ncbi:MAG: ABC transporter permease, partial [Bacteroidetes bacterium]|nr:ABC transporter permease [Bacteroidota bacterium]
MKFPFTPKWANRLLETFIPLSLIEEFRGDLEEVYYERLENMSPLKARLWYWADTFSLVYKFFSWKPSFLKNPTAMYSNYFKMAFRQIKKSKFYSALNILGLSMGFATFFLLFMYVNDEFSYDTFHEKADQTYRVACDLETPGKIFNMALTPPWVGPKLAENFPEIESWTRISNGQGQMKFGEKQFQEDHIYIAEQGFLEMFSFPILQGNTSSALKEPYQLVFTESTARKYFGEENPIGQTVLFGIDEKPYTVTGVVAQPPSNSQFSFDILMSFATIEHENPDISTGRWFWFDYYTYIALDPQADYKALEAKLPEFLQKVA